MAESLFGGVAEGLGQTVVPAMQRQQESKLALMLQSQKIEQEAQAKQKEAQQQHELGMVPSGQVGAIGKQFGLPELGEAGPMSQGILEAVTKAAGEVASRHAMLMMSSPSQAQVVNDPQTGIPTDHMLTNALGIPLRQIPIAGAAEKVKEGTAILNAEQDLQSTLSKIKNIDPGRLSGLGAELAGLTGVGMSPDVKAFKEAKVFLATEMPKALAGMSRFNDPEFQRISQALGGTFSTPQELASTGDMVQQFINHRKNSLGMKITVPDSSMQSQGQPQGGMPTAQDPSQAQAVPSTGGLTQNDFAAEDARRASLAPAPKQGKR